MVTGGSSVLVVPSVLLCGSVHRRKATEKGMIKIGADTIDVILTQDCAVEVTKYGLVDQKIMLEKTRSLQISKKMTAIVTKKMGVDGQSRASVHGQASLTAGRHTHIF